MLESHIQKLIIASLKKWGWMPVKLMVTNTNGIPDIMALRYGQTVFLEIKQPGKQPTDLQLHRHKQLNDAGFIVVVATSLNDVMFLKD